MGIKAIYLKLASIGMDGGTNSMRELRMERHVMVIGLGIGTVRSSGMFDGIIRRA